MTPRGVVGHGGFSPLYPHSGALCATGSSAARPPRASGHRPLQAASRLQAGVAAPGARCGGPVETYHTTQHVRSKAWSINGHSSRVDSHDSRDQHGDVENTDHPFDGDERLSLRSGRRDVAQADGRQRHEAEVDE